MNLKNLKYPLYLFVVILIAKIGYVVVESFYNYHVLYTTTSSDLSREVIEQLNLTGHRISAIGITLLLLPLLYLGIKKFSKLKIVSLVVLTFLTYIIAYQSLNIIVEKIVTSNKEHRYDAYYINIFKYGILNNIFAYDSFIENEKIKNDTLEVNDRILLTNTFLLLHADKKLIAKLKERGKEKVADLYIKRELQDDYNQKYNSFKDASSQIGTLWDKFNSSRKALKTNLQKLQDEKTIKDAYKKLTTSLQNSFQRYQDGWNKLNLIIREETKIYKINSIKKDLEKYFRYERYQKAKIQYKEKMIQKFGHFIEPKRWKDEKGKLTNKSIENVIIQEIVIKSKKQMNNLPKGLSVKEFMYHDTTKLLVADKLKKQDILIPYDFDYSYKQFKKYFEVMSSKKIGQAYDTFYTKLEKKIGKNDLKLDMNWDAYINSDFIRSQVVSKIKSDNVSNILQAIQSKDLSNFKKMVYLPTVIDKVDEMMYKEEDFLDGKRAAHHGDEAIKLLYIPPFALAVSIIALLLNIVTVISMLLSATNISKKVQLSVRSIVFLIIIAIPFLAQHKALNNPMIQQSTTDETKLYLEFLSWISFFEKVNIDLHK